MRCLAWLPIVPLLAVAACASTQVRGVATGSVASPAYELTGRSLFVLQQQAEALCPQGHVVVRQWERQRRAEADAGVAEHYLQTAAGWLKPSEADAAQMTVQCRA